MWTYLGPTQSVLVTGVSLFLSAQRTKLHVDGHTTSKQPDLCLLTSYWLCMWEAFIVSYMNVHSCSDGDGCQMVVFAFDVYSNNHCGFRGICMLFHFAGGILLVMEMFTNH